MNPIDESLDYHGANSYYFKPPPLSTKGKDLYEKNLHTETPVCIISTSTPTPNTTNTAISKYMFDDGETWARVIIDLKNYPDL